MNPYDFVRLVGNAPQRQSPLFHNQFDGVSGRIHCRLIAYTPLFIPQYRAGAADRRSPVHETLKFCRGRDNQPFIPGTSLKGVIRSVAEAAANGCFTLPNRFTYQQGALEYNLPNGFLTCNNKDQLCPTCRLFGMLNRGTVFAGNVSVGDAHVNLGWKSEMVTLAILSAPKPRHTPFYSKQPAERRPPIRGRKFYYHHPQGPLTRTVKDGQNKTVEAILAGAVFEFDVDYANITQEDLNLLLFALEMWKDTCHKVGMGKPIGLGSAKIEILWMKSLDTAARYRQLGGGWVASLEGGALGQALEQCLGSYRGSSQPNLLDLHRILHWDASLAISPHYPGQEWFKANRDTPLEGAP